MAPQHESSPAAAPVRVWKRRKVRRGPPVWLFPCVGACVVLLILFPLAHQFGWLRPASSPAPAPAPAKAEPAAPDPALQPPADLVLSEVQVRSDGPTRYLEGRVRNNSARRYDKVEVLLGIRSRTGGILGTITGRIDSVGPNSTAAFRTEALPEGAFRHTLREITGTQK